MSKGYRQSTFAKRGWVWLHLHLTPRNTSLDLVDVGKIWNIKGDVRRLGDFHFEPGTIFGLAQPFDRFHSVFLRDSKGLKSPLGYVA